MPRPKKCRRVCSHPGTDCFRPKHLEPDSLDVIVLERDEFDAIKLSDIDKISQTEASNFMQISRQTYGRILSSAHNKIALAIYHGFILKINK